MAIWGGKRQIRRADDEEMWAEARMGMRVAGGERRVALLGSSTLKREKVVYSPKEMHEGCRNEQSEQNTVPASTQTEPRGERVVLFNAQPDPSREA